VIGCSGKDGTGAPGSGGVVVDPAALGVSSWEIAGLPVANAFLERLGVAPLIAGYLPLTSRQRRSAVTGTLGVLIRALVLGRQPLYGLGEWASRFDPRHLGLAPGETLSDDRVGRALDVLYEADRASLTTAVSLAAVERFGIALDELHNDSTSIRLYGAYRPSGAGSPDPGRLTPARGHSKDHRPDLKQLVWILTVSADGVVPVTYRLANGNTIDDTTHIATWETCRRLAGRADFLYVADCKLASKKNMTHIHGAGGRFVTVMPRSRKEDGTGRAWLGTGDHAWEEVARRPGRTRSDPPDVWWMLPAPDRSAEGFRIVWLRSSTKARTASEARAKAIKKATAAVVHLSGCIGLRGHKLTNREQIQTAADAAIAKAGASRWVQAVVTEEQIPEHKKVSPGRPGPNTRYEDVVRSVWSVNPRIDQATADADAGSDGCFPLITNDEQMSLAALYAAYKAQPHIEKRHALLKGVLEAAPMELKSETRIDAFGFCLYIALLVHALIERELRRNMAAAGVAQLPLYHEARACRAPTAMRVLEILQPLARTVITHHARTLTAIEPHLDGLQLTLLELLGVAPATYRQNAGHEID